MVKRDHLKEVVLGVITALIVYAVAAFLLLGCSPAEAPADKVTALKTYDIITGFIVGMVGGFIVNFFFLNRFVQREKLRSNAQAICDAFNACYLEGNTLLTDLELVNNTLPESPVHYAIQYEQKSSRFVVVELLSADSDFSELKPRQ
ncbi:MAG TPA: hypothetical protein PKC38_00575 [Chitinophagales bacterium]|nr:hypothetical protein [Chitinophagales bacterium]